MVRLTLIARIQDGLPLAEGLDSEKDTDIDQYKAQAKVGHECHEHFLRAVSCLSVFARKSLQDA